MTIATPKRRWLRFSLRGMFVLVTVLGVWLGWNASIVRQRQAARAEFLNEGWELNRDGSPDPIRLPWIRRLLGDEPVGAIYVDGDEGPLPC